MLIAPDSKLVMIGDSITDAGRERPIGEGRGAALGTGYVAFVDGLLASTYPGRRIRVVNVGTSGNTVRDLKARWQTDVVDLKPDWLSVMIGINDVWRRFDSPLRTEIHVGIEEYQATLDELVAWTKPMVKGLVVMTPYHIESNRQDAMRAQMDRYGAAATAVAKKHGAICVDMQAAFDRFLAHRHSASIAWDRVHPNHTGHMVMARAFLDGIGFDWSGAR
jgi:lysophospholipase L1-like esterase